MSTYFCSFVTHTSPLTPTTGSVWCQLSRKRQFKCDVLILVLHKTYKMYICFFSFITGDIGHSDGCHTADVYCPGERKNKQKPTQVLHASDTIYRAKLTTQQILKEARSPLLRYGDRFMIIIELEKQKTDAQFQFHPSISMSKHEWLVFLMLHYINLIMIRSLFRGNMEAN